MTELRAPTRYRKREHSDSTFAWLLGLGVVLVAMVGFEHYRAVQADAAALMHQAAMDEQRRQNEALRPLAEEPAVAQRQPDYWEVESSSAVAIAPRHDPYAAQRNAEEAIAIMHGTRRIQREWDRQQYSESAPDPVIVGDSSRQESSQCGSLRAERHRIESAMRRGFRNGQDYRDRLNEIWHSMVSLRCDMRRL